jgi:hypothetical protein
MRKIVLDINSISVILGSVIEAFSGWLAGHLGFGKATLKPDYKRILPDGKE